LITRSMNSPHLRNLDLNLLRVFVALLDEGSATRAGQRLGITQSAVSHALNRLRYVLADELFVRGPAGMQPTVRASSIAPRIRRGLADLQAVLGPEQFSAAETEREFVIATGAYVASILVPPTVARVRAEAPGVRSRLRNAPASMAEELDAGRIDIAFGLFGRTPDRFTSEPVFQDRLVWVMRSDHPSAGEPLTVESLAAASHVIVALSDGNDLVQGSVVEQGLERRVVLRDLRVADEFAARGLEFQVGLTVPDMHTALAVAARSDMVALAPRGLARMFAPALGLALLESPLPSPASEVHGLWRRDNDGPALQWLRGVLRAAGAAFMETQDD
jgi:DNA-binding transcriptional LysR family regulator